MLSLRLTLYLDPRCATIFAQKFYISYINDCSLSTVVLILIRSASLVGSDHLVRIHQASLYTPAGEKGNPAQGHICLQFVAQGLA